MQVPCCAVNVGAPVKEGGSWTSAYS